MELIRFAGEHGHILQMDVASKVILWVSEFHIKIYIMLHLFNELKWLLFVLTLTIIAFQPIIYLVFTKYAILYSRGIVASSPSEQKRDCEKEDKYAILYQNGIGGRKYATLHRYPDRK